METIIKKTVIFLSTFVVMLMAAALIVVVHVAKFIRRVFYGHG